MRWISSRACSFSGLAKLIFIGPTGEFQAKLIPAAARICERSNLSFDP